MITINDYIIIYKELKIYAKLFLWTYPECDVLKGASKNYVTARGGEGVDDFVTYRYVYFWGRGGIL